MRRALWIALFLGLPALLVLPLSGPLAAPLSGQIESTRDAVNDKRAEEGVLSQDIAGYNGKIERLQGQIAGLQGREDRLQADLDAKLAELEAVRGRLDAARQRLEELKAELAVAEHALGERLVELYKADEPDALTVVLEADGFADLLERTEYMERVSDQDQRVIRRVRDLKARVTKQADELEELERREQAAAEAITARRNEIAAAKQEVVGASSELEAARDELGGALAQIRNSRVRLEGNLGELEAEQRQVQARLAAAQERQAAAPVPGSPAIPPLSAQPIRSGSGGLIFPVNGPLSSPFGMRWGRLHAGIDISAPEGTPIRAAKAGRVVLMAPTGGYGNYTCVDHGGSLSTCYAHQSRYGTSVGASVSQGQVIGFVGNTGNSFGAHLHFETRVGGSPVDPLGYL